MLGWLKRHRSGDPASIGHYKITKRLGAGGMGVVYAAQDERLGRSVAIKMIQETSRDPRARERLWREARSAASVSHPNICQVHEIGDLNDEPYIVMELLVGESLEGRLGNGALPVEEALRIGLELLAGLGALHRQGLLHRDLKPSNVFITPHGVKLLDFGLARVADGAWSAEASEPALTQTGVLVGTPRYMSPEQLTNQELGPGTDIFVLGAILHEMVSGKPAFSGNTLMELFQSILSGEPASLDGAPAPLNTVLARAMARKPEDRYPSCELMARDLEFILRALPGTPAAAPSPTGRTGQDALVAGREALARRRWAEAFEKLTRAEASGEILSAEDLEGLGEAAMWSGHHEASIAARQRAHSLHLSDGNPRRAALVALALVNNHYIRLKHSVAAGWFSKAQRLLENEPEGFEHGQLATFETMFLMVRGDFDAVLEKARTVFEIGRRYANHDLQAIGLTLQGFALVRMGHSSRGMPLLDEAMASALGGGLGQLATGITYCRTISACMESFDYRRALEWTNEVERCFETTGTVGFPGECRAFRAALHVLRGDLARGEEEARIASSESETFNLGHCGIAWYEIGEIQRRRGKIPAAEEAFQRAQQAGVVPFPGLSLLRFAEGRTVEAARSIAAALAESGGDRLTRARLLPAQIEIALAGGDVDTARACTVEMVGIADAFGSTALHATSECLLGALAFTTGDVEESVRRFRSGFKLWVEIDAPYEAARARLRLAQAQGALGDQAGAVLEARTARSFFEGIGADPDVRWATRVLEALGTAG